MTELELNEMTKKQLADYAEKNGIDIDSKNVKKITNAEYVNSILAAEQTTEVEEVEIDEEEQDDLGDIDDFLSNDDDELPMPVKGRKKELTPKEKRDRKKQKFDEMHELKRVIITANGDSQTRAKNQVEYCTWGNASLGHNTDKFPLGKPWHVREGALRNLSGMTTTSSIQDDEGNSVRFETVKAYIVQRLDPLTEDERDIIGKRQTIRDNSIEAKL